MRDYILSQITRRQRTLIDLDKQIEGIERQRLEIRAEMRAYEDMLGHAQADGETGPTHLSPVAANNAHYVRRSNGSGRLRDSNWRGLYAYIAREWPNSVSTNAMVDYAASAGLTLTRQAIRAQTSTYTQKGCLERIGMGLYRMTAQGAAELGIELQEKGAAASSQTMESAADSAQHDAESGRVVAG